MALTISLVEMPSSNPTQRPPLKRTRSSLPCDGCAVRRVRCDSGRPCTECTKRNLACTTLRVIKRRGPKGPRQSTNRKVWDFQEALRASNTSSSSDDGAACIPVAPTPLASPLDQFLPDCQQSPTPSIGPTPVYITQPFEAYRKYLDLFSERLYNVWPVLSSTELMDLLIADEDDHHSWALAASVCAAVIAQLRLPEHNFFSEASLDGEAISTSHQFAADANHFREQFDYRETPSLSSVLTSFFLHVYCANDDRLRAAGLYLREALTLIHMLGMHLSNSYTGLLSEERELRLRVYWILFVSERTFCVQNGLPAILRPIPERPSPDKPVHGCSGSPILSFLHLTKIFTFLEGDLIEPSSQTLLDSCSNPCSELEASTKQALARSRVARFQSNLERTEEGVGLDETQRVDLFTTRSWIRILLWGYTVRHYAMSCAADEPAFSMMLPALVAHQMLGFFSGVSPSSIKAHGYGMELKLFGVADALLDLISCGQSTPSANGMLVGSRDALHSIESALHTVGGSDSAFLKKLRRRMVECDLPVQILLQPSIVDLDFCDPANGESAAYMDEGYLDDWHTDVTN